MRRRPPRTAILLLTLSLSGCTLAEVISPDSEDMLVIEAVLRPDLMLQRVLLHSSLTATAGGAERGARVTVRTSSGREIVFDEVDEAGFCVEAEPTIGRVGCYLSPSQEGYWVRQNEEYELRIETPDGRSAFARTRVPGDFRLIRPPSEIFGPCHLHPETALTLEWTRASGAWAYLAVLDLSGLRAALAARLPGEIPDSLSLTGLAISEADTTLVLPGEFGIFQRTEFDQPLLIALRDGLPSGVFANVVLAAIDRNYANAVRGGSFNPSGRVRIPSVTGDATGVFGSMVVDRTEIEVREPELSRSCLGVPG